MLDIIKCGAVVECQIVDMKDVGSRPGNTAFETFQLCRRSSTFLKFCKKKFDIYSKIVFRDAENIFRHQAELVLRHQMLVSNYFVNFFYSAGTPNRLHHYWGYIWYLIS